MKQKLFYVRKNWQLYVFFLMPALVFTIIFKYLPMGGILMAFEDYNVRLGLLGSEWVGLDYFKRFLSSPDFMSYLLNTLKLSLYGLLWGFPMPIILALLLNQIRSVGIKKKIQLLIYAPNFISVMWYGENVFISGRTAQSNSGNINKLDDNAGGVSDNLHCQWYMARCRVGFHHVYRSPIKCK